MAKKDATVVLVHGAWADGSSWAKVISPLAASGVKAVAAPLPLTSFHDDVAALDRTLERVGERVVLVGHAYAGAAIGATRSEKVKALVYVAALAPDEGETVADVSIAASRIRWRPSSRPTRTGGSICPKRRSAPPSHKTPRKKNWRCWRRSSGRSRLPASLSGWSDRYGRTGPSGFWSLSRTA
jgi:pimeloyl-ACP methyl ester carboxylesterase